eukprot:TRINITY_DN18856_c0_g1_i1.p1 TRINITY_DN18856_c0_g1~~TRINITY_DN18856_c0_g1_i1.p1  ORF type:complete len:145 (+),score=61.71 TRINITY_DN18856_c0_g1_i1:37-435(+)
MKEVLSGTGNAYDVILMDCMMPEMDGYTATREIRKMEQAIGGVEGGAAFAGMGASGRRRVGMRHVIIALTANVMSGEKEKCLQAGMDDYISKPILLNELVKKLEQYIPTKMGRLSRQAAPFGSFINTSPLAK